MEKWKVKLNIQGQIHRQKKTIKPIKHEKKPISTLIGRNRKINHWTKSRASSIPSFIDLSTYWGDYKSVGLEVEEGRKTFWRTHRVEIQGSYKSDLIDLRTIFILTDNVSKMIESRVRTIVHVKPEGLRVWLTGTGHLDTHTNVLVFTGHNTAKPGEKSRNSVLYI